jgi:hypothetical protein
MRSQLCQLLIAIAALQAGSAFAALGSGPSDFSKASEGRQPKVLAAVSGQAYHVSESTLASGTVVREYVSAKGVVFAVSWSGPFLPDLQTLLGKHFNTMVAEAGKVPRAGHSQLHIARPEVNIQSTGHMRAFQGKAWVAGDFPAGFSVSDIQ